MDTIAPLASVTGMIVTFIAEAIPSVTVTARSLDVARDGLEGSQANVFLFAVDEAVGLRNEATAFVQGNTTPRSPLALNLRYLITTYDAGNDDLGDQRLLGRIVGLLHDHPEITPQDVGGALSEPRFASQVERIQVDRDVRSFEETLKLWRSFTSSGYRLSAMYEVRLLT